MFLRREMRQKGVEKEGRRAGRCDRKEGEGYRFSRQKTMTRVWKVLFTCARGGGRGAMGMRGGAGGGKETGALRLHPPRPYSPPLTSCTAQRSRAGGRALRTVVGKVGGGRVGGVGGWAGLVGPSLLADGEAGGAGKARAGKASGAGRRGDSERRARGRGDGRWVVTIRRD